MSVPKLILHQRLGRVGGCGLGNFPRLTPAHMRPTGLGLHLEKMVFRISSYL